MPRKKLVLALAITSLSACSHIYKPEPNNFISKSLPKPLTFCGDNSNRENCTLSNQKEVNKSVLATQLARLPKGSSLKTVTELKKNVPSTATSKVADSNFSKTKISNGTTQNKEVAEFSTAFNKDNQPDTAVSNSPTIFNIQYPDTNDKRKICLDTNQPTKNRLALHPNWDSLKKIEINKTIFKQPFINEPLQDDIVTLSNIRFDGDKVITSEDSEDSTTKQRDNAPNQTRETRFRAIKLPRNYESYRSLIAEIAEQTQVDPALLHAIIQAESSYNPHARSSRGAVGLMQLMPATARRFGAKNLTDPIANVYAGARYLRYLLELFDNNKKLALAGYNAGEYAVKRHGNKVPPFRQTQKYVNKVMSLYEAHRNKM